MRLFTNPTSYVHPEREGQMNNGGPKFCVFPETAADPRTARNTKEWIPLSEMRAVFMVG